ncbi:SGNH/GDSL hydrolase family protein [Neobacillus sp. SAB-20_R2A]|uniref:SGNH/GDSL hydrolase family protein n=1 Tax=Neobacillus sp. SAB-20_R2A TaxID=3120519 RepID=UPI003C6E0F05
MQKVIVALLGIIFIIVLYLGQSHWKQQIADTSANMKTDYYATLQKEYKKTRGAAAGGVGSVAANGQEDLVSLTKNWPAGAVERFKKTLADGSKFKILFVGSGAIGSEGDGTFPLVKKSLVDAFEAKHIEVDLITYGSNSSQFLKENKEKDVAGAGADLIIYEPFILQNNGAVGMDKSLADLTTVMESVKTEKPGVAFILQPSIPLYKAKNYPVQVAQLKDYAKKNGIAYLDHWTSWPDPNTEAIKEYLTPNQSGPSDKGVQLWSEALAAYLISK